MGKIKISNFYKKKKITINNINKKHKNTHVKKSL